MSVLKRLDRSISAWDAYFTELLWANIARYLPKKLVYWGMIHAWHSYEVQFDWETHQTAPMWRVIQEYMNE